MLLCWFYVILSYYVFRPALCCPFPQFLQSGGRGVEWLGEVSEDGANFTYSVTFRGRIMRSIATRGSEELKKDQEMRPWAFQRECLIEVTAGRFLCSHRKFKDDYENRYVCMAFIIRSEDVIQYRESSVVQFQDPHLCSSEQLRLNDRPLVNRNAFLVSSHPCPPALTGGYNVRMFDRRHGHGVCDAFEGTTRIEAQCSAAEDQGLVFRFRFPQCVPEGLGMNTEQRTFCIASWTDDDNTYCVIRHDSSQRAWCLRYHTRLVTTGSFAAYLFTGLRCNRDPVPDGSVGCIVLDMRADLTPKVQRSLCADDYEACLWGNPCKDYLPDMQLACPRRCGVCNDTLPRLCTLPSWIRGKWGQMDSNETLEVDEGEITSSSLGGRYQCVEWQGGSPASDIRGRHGSHVVDVMLVKKFSNGCRHRYVCSQWKLVHESMSFLLKYRFSRSQVWPFDDATPFRSIGCHLFQYGDDVHPHRDRYTSRRFRSLVRADAAPVDCDFPDVAGDEITVTFADLVRCTGHLRAFHDRGVTKMRLVVHACPGGWYVRQFMCIGKTSHSDGKLIVTFLEQTSEYYCWIFPSILSADFYLLSISDCAADVYDKVASGVLQPIMSFQSGPIRTESHTSICAEFNSCGNTSPTAELNRDNVTRKTAIMLSNAEKYRTHHSQTNSWSKSATTAKVERVSHAVGIASVSRSTTALNKEYNGDKSYVNNADSIGNSADDTRSSADESGNSDDTENSSDNTKTSADVTRNLADDIVNSAGDNSLKEEDSIKANDEANDRKKDEDVGDNTDYSRDERSQTKFNNGIEANKRNDVPDNTIDKEDEVTKEVDIDRVTAKNTLNQTDNGDLESIRWTEHTPLWNTDVRHQLNKLQKSRADEPFEVTKMSNRLKDMRRASNIVSDDDDDKEGSTYQQTDDSGNVDDVDMATTFYQTDDIEVIDDFSELSTPSLLKNITVTDDGKNVTSIFQQISGVKGNSSNDVEGNSSNDAIIITSTTIVSLRRLAITSSATSKDRLFCQAVSAMYAFVTWKMAATVLCSDRGYQAI